MSSLSVLAQISLSQVIQRRPLIAPPNALIHQVAQQMHQAQASCVLVMEQQLVGIFTERDAVRAIATGNLDDMQVSAQMTRQTVSIDESELETIFFVLQVFRQQQIQYLPVFNQGQVSGLITLQDVTASLEQVVNQYADQIEQETSDRLQVEAALRQAEEKYRSIFENALDGIFQTSSDGKYLSANPALAKLYGYDSPDALIAAQPNFNQQLYVDPARRIQFINLMSQEGKLSNFESQIYKQDGSIIWISETCRAVRDSKSELLYYEGIVQDISDRKQHEAERQTAEQTLQQRNEELSSTLQQLRATQAELIQSEKMAALGQLVAGIAHEINTPLGAIRSSIENIADFLAETLQHLPDFFRQLPQDRYLEFIALMERSSQNKDSFSSKEKRQFKRQLIRELERLEMANADTIADTLVDMGIYDDIAPFLALIKDQTHKNLLKTAYQLNSLSKSTSTIITATDRAAKMVFALRTYARYDVSAKKIEASVTDGIETVLTLYYNQLKQGVEVQRNFADLPAILCYPDELNQVWTNLIHNALQAMEYRGTLRIDVAQSETQILINITDSGKGIPPEVLPNIFDPFFTTKPAGEGSGLGLDIVQKIVKKHQGNITVTSIPGNTTFTVSLPITPKDSSING
jgi:PAS domain S-box-containing protein